MSDEENKVVLPGKSYTQMDSSFAESIIASVTLERDQLRAKLSHALQPILSGEEMKVAEKNCDWVAFQHAFHAVMKCRAAAIRSRMGGENE